MRQEHKYGTFSFLTNSMLNMTAKEQTVMMKLFFLKLGVTDRRGFLTEL